MCNPCSCLVPVTPNTCTYDLGGAHYIQTLLLLTLVGDDVLDVVGIVVVVFVVLLFLFLLLLLLFRIPASSL